MRFVAFGRSEAPHRNRLFMKNATVKSRFFIEEESLMTAFIVNEQLVSGGCYPFFTLQIAHSLQTHRLPTRWKPVLRERRFRFRPCVHVYH